MKKLKFLKLSRPEKVWLALLFLAFSQPLFASVQDEIDSRQNQIEELNRQIEEYETEIQQKQGEAKTFSNEIFILNNTVKRLQSEINSLSLAIEQTKTQIELTAEQIIEAENDINKYQRSLGYFLRAINRTEQENLVEILVKNRTLAAFFDSLNHLQSAQTNLRTAIGQIKNLKSELENKNETLSEQKEELENLKSIQRVQQRSAEQTRLTKDILLRETKGEESRFQQLVKKSKANIETIRAQIFYLQQNGVTAEEAVKYGQLAALGTGIRPAFLLAILEIESGLGRNVGTGNWLDDMYQCYLRLGKPERAQAEKSAFLQIVSQLGLDPNQVKVSREPNYGCGGAMGPAQFIPTTWLGYAEEVARLTGHNPSNPWRVEDAFTAAALKLARAGATDQSKIGETRAAKAYLSGRPACTSYICNYYASAVLRKAAEIAQSL